MNNNDIYNDENIHTNDSVNSNKELISYTKNEISHEMDILSRSFDSVRLVNPFECCVTQIEDKKTAVSYTHLDVYKRQTASESGMLSSTFSIFCPLSCGRLTPDIRISFCQHINILLI